MQCAIFGKVFEDLRMIVRKILIYLGNLDRYLLMLHLLRWGTPESSENGLFRKLEKKATLIVTPLWNLGNKICEWNVRIELGITSIAGLCCPSLRYA